MAMISACLPIVMAPVRIQPPAVRVRRWCACASPQCRRQKTEQRCSPHDVHLLLSPESLQHCANLDGQGAVGDVCPVAPALDQDRVDTQHAAVSA
jgi:hypothetical protein